MLMNGKSCLIPLFKMKIISRDELRDIASSDDVVFNTSEFDLLVETATTTAIRQAVCGKLIIPIYTFKCNLCCLNRVN